MNKKISKSKNESNFSNNDHNLDIEKVVDKILLEKCSKTTDINKKEIQKKNIVKKELDFKQFSPENNQKDSIYFIRGKKVKKDNNKNNTNNNNNDQIKNKKIRLENARLRLKKLSFKRRTHTKKKDDKNNKLTKTDTPNNTKKKVKEKTNKPNKKIKEKTPSRFHLRAKTTSEKPKQKKERKFLKHKKSVKELKTEEKEGNIKNTANSEIPQGETSKEIPKKSKFFKRSTVDKNQKEGSDKKIKKGLFSKKFAKKEVAEEEVDLKDRRGEKKGYKKSVEFIDKFVRSLTSDEANWLDQKIKETKPLDTEIKKEGLKETAIPSKTMVDEVTSKKLKLFKKGIRGKNRKEGSLKKEKKGILSKKSHTEIYEIPFLKDHKQEKKEVILSKKDSKHEKDIIITEKEIGLLRKKKKHGFRERIKKGSSKKSSLDALDEDITKTAAVKKENLIENIVPDGEIQLVEEAQELKSNTIRYFGYSEGSYEELDFYPLHEPFAYVEIIREKDTLDKRYILVEVKLSEKESNLLNFIKETMNSFTLNTFELEESGERKYLINKIDQILEDYMIVIDEDLKQKIIYFLEKEFLGLNKLEVLMQDPNIEDISCDGSGVPIFLYHRRFGSLKGSIQFDDEEELSAFVVRLAQKCGKHISIAEPMLDATMPDGSRIQMTLSTEVTTKGSTFTIRKFKEDPFSPPDLIEFNTMSSEMIAYMWVAVENGINALIAGGTAAGKTSTLNALSLFIPRESKIVSIEETREINLPHPNWIPGVSRSGFGEVVGNKVIGEIDLYDLMKAALRQRPEYILVGEIRGREAYVLFQAMSTGHTTYSTVHADSAQSLIHRLEGKPINIPRIMLQALDIVCIQVISRIKNKRARRVKQIIEIIDIDPATKEILTNEVFRWDPVEDKFIYSGKSYILERVRAEKDKTREEMTNEIKNRAKLLEWMNKNNVREFKKVATLISQYFDNSEQVMKKILVQS